MTPKELRDAGWKYRRDAEGGAPRTVWTRGDIEIVTCSSYPKMWELRVMRGSDILAFDSTWSSTLTEHMHRLSRDIAVRIVDGAPTFRKVQRYEEFPKDAVSLRQWALTPATP